MANQVSSVADNARGETTITYTNAAPLDGVNRSSGSFAAGISTEVDVTSYITGNGTYSLALYKDQGTQISLGSRESAVAPELVVET